MLNIEHLDSDFFKVTKFKRGSLNIPDNNYYTQKVLLNMLFMKCIDKISSLVTNSFLGKFKSCYRRGSL